MLKPSGEDLESLPPALLEEESLPPAPPAEDSLPPAPPAEEPPELAMPGEEPLPPAPLGGEEATAALATSESQSRLIAAGFLPRPPRMPGLDAGMIPASAVVRPDSYEPPSHDAPGELAEPFEVDVEHVGIPRSLLPSDRPPIGRLGRYDVVGRLGAGGMAEILLAREVSAAATRYVAIKLIRAEFASNREFAAMFKDEGKVLLELKHPNICHVYEFGMEGKNAYIAMEWVNGISLHKLVQRLTETGQTMPVPEALRIVAQVAEALDYAHRAKDRRGRPLGIVHRDVSPHNIMVTYEGVVKLLDFGIAKAADRSSETHSGTIKGKFAYISPEQVLSKGVDGRTDVFSLGVCLWELLTGMRLFKRASDYERVNAVVTEPIPSVRATNPEIPEELAGIVAKAVQRPMENRFATAGQLQEALEHFLSDQREIVNTPRVARYIQGIFALEMAQGPELDTSEEVSHAILSQTGPSLTVEPLVGSDSEELRQYELPEESEVRLPQRRGRGLFVLFALLLVAAAAVGAWIIAGSPDLTGSPRASEPRVRDVVPTAAESGARPEPVPAAEGNDEGSLPGDVAPAENHLAEGEPATAAEEAATVSDDPEAEARRERRRDERREERRRRRTEKRAHMGMGTGYVTNPGF